MATVSAPTFINRLGRSIGTRLRGVKGVDRLLRSLHHPDKRSEWYFETIARALPSGPQYNIQSRWFTEWTTYFYGSQDEAIHRWIQQNARPDWVAFDIGMNFGYFACLLGEKCAEVHGFEPIPWLVERAKANVKLNSLTNVHVNEIALSDSTGTANINVPANTDSNWGKSSLVHQSTSADALSVATQKLDEYVQQLNLSRLDFIKLDVEGAEHFVLRGGNEALSAFHPTIIFERNSESMREMVAILRDLGYSFYCSDNRAVGASDYSEWPPDVLATCKSTAGIGLTRLR